MERFRLALALTTLPGISAALSALAVMLWVLMSSVAFSLFSLAIRWRLLRMRTFSRYLGLINWRRSYRRLFDPLRYLLVRLRRLVRATLTPLTLH